MRDLGQISPVILSGQWGDLSDLSKGHTRLQNTVRQFFSDIYQPPIFICAPEEVSVVRAQMDAIGMKIGKILIEPTPKNTAMTTAITALHARTVEEDALMLIVTPDHHIERVDSIGRTIVAGVPAVANGHIMSFGITPSCAATEYKYIRKGEAMSPGAFAIEGYVGKPSSEVAETYFRSGDYYWNAGVFLVNSGAFLKDIELISPEVASSAKTAYLTARKEDRGWVLGEQSCEVSRRLTLNGVIKTLMPKTGVIPFHFVNHDRHKNLFVEESQIAQLHRA